MDEDVRVVTDWGREVCVTDGCRQEAMDEDVRVVTDWGREVCVTDGCR